MFLLIISLFIISPKEKRYNDSLIIQNFQNIVNQYRRDNGLQELTIDFSLKEFSENQCNYITLNKLSHGTGEFSLEKRAKPLLGRYKFIGENLTSVTVIPNYYYVDSEYKPIEEFEKISKKISMGEETEYDIAMYCFLRWKYSPSHNSLLLDKESKWFYLSVNQTNRTKLYFQFTSAG